MELNKHKTLKEKNLENDRDNDDEHNENEDDSDGEKDDIEVEENIDIYNRLILHRMCPNNKFFLFEDKLNKVLRVYELVKGGKEQIDDEVPTIYVFIL
jgi:hypothetical protein